MTESGDKTESEVEGGKKGERVHGGTSSILKQLQLQEKLCKLIIRMLPFLFVCQRTWLARANIKLQISNQIYDSRSKGGVCNRPRKKS